MTRWKMRTVALLACLMFLVAAVGCQSTDSADDKANQSNLTTSPGESVSTDVDTGDMAFDFSNFDADESTEGSSVKLTFSASGVSGSGNGVKVSGTTVTISKEGVYHLSGSCDNGCVVVAAGDQEQVKLVLDSLTLTNKKGPAFYLKSADKVAITLSGKSTLSDGSSYSFADDDSADGAIFSRADLVINGAGSLTVNGNADNGIVSKDDLIVYNGTLTVTAVNDAIQGKDCVKIHGGTLTLNAGGDGIQASNSEDASRGFVYIEGGKINITAGADGIQAETVVRVTGGTVTAKTGGGSANASTKSEWGSWGGPGGFGGNQNSTATETSDSAKGIKAGSLIQITDGTITLDTSDDAVHANGDVQIDGGTFSIQSGDDGIHADDALLINGGTVTISKSYEGLEGSCITVTGGTVSVTASDDGINAAGGNDSSAMGRPGENSFSSSSTHYVRISGGYVYLNASGDGLDSNGSLYIDGGVTLVSGPTDNGNGAIDYDSDAKITGGVLIAAGSTGMAQNMGSESTQGSALYTFSGSQSGGISLAVTDADGKLIASFTPAKTYQCVVVSAPALTVGNTYTVTVGGTVSNADKQGFSDSGTLSGGTKNGTFTMSSLIEGSSGAGGMGGGGGFGGGGGMGGGMGGRR